MFEFEARGHVNVRASHSSTIEVTKDLDLTLRGDCVVAVASTRAAADLPARFKELARLEGCRIKLVLRVGEVVDEVSGYGSPLLTFLDDRSMVFRRSKYICPRTIMIRADKAARHLSRRLIERLRDPSAVVKLKLEACF
ncbi:MAG: DUF371 domain-containing protein [Candidatus Nezhaarchaeota archaeon]|nr:DUF371 domain-containing protein [Candidatus Nezhaarchaeota archaeon]